MSAYAWIIDKDNEPDHSKEAPCNANARGMMGPSDITEEQTRRLLAGEGERFRMIDGTCVIYEGRFIGDANDETAFGPLDDFGMPNYGCEAIEYYENGKWSLL